MSGSLKRPEPAVVGDVRHYRGQRYEAVSAKPYRRVDGTLTEIITWQSECATCGEPFTTMHPAQASKFQPNRRCQAHKRPGQKVRTPSK